jgi:hypothetical protein
MMSYDLEKTGNTKWGQKFMPLQWPHIDFKERGQNNFHK